MKLLIIIPAYNEEKMIGKVIDSLKKYKKNKNTDLLVIDDGSLDNTYKTVKQKKVTVIRHIINRGLGVSLGTGFAYAAEHDFDYVVTFDADGQHQAADINKIIKPLTKRKADVVIGSRLIDPANKMPKLRKIINYLSNIATFILFNLWTTDSQSGLRGFNREAVLKIKIKSQRMEVSSEIFKEIKRLKLSMIEVPIKSVYTDYSIQKGQPVSNAPNVFWKLILHKFNNI